MLNSQIISEVTKKSQKVIKGKAGNLLSMRSLLEIVDTMNTEEIFKEYQHLIDFEDYSKKFKGFISMGLPKSSMNEIKSFHTKAKKLEKLLINTELMAFKISLIDPKYKDLLNN